MESTFITFRSNCDNLSEIVGQDLQVKIFFYVCFYESEIRNIQMLSCIVLSIAYSKKPSQTGFFSNIHH